MKPEPKRDADPREYGRCLPDGSVRIHAPWSGWSTSPGSLAFLAKDATPARDQPEAADA